LKGKVREIEAMDAQLLLTRVKSGYDWEAAYDGMLNLLNVPYGVRPIAAEPLKDEDIDPAVLRDVTRIRESESS
jgi:hypothetical protein